MPHPAYPKPSTIWCTSLLMLIAALAISWQIASPSDIDDNEQPITLAHFMDVATQGHLLTQINPFEGLSTKPPAYHWLGGALVKITGTQAQWQLKLSSILCFGVTLALIVALARTSLNWQASLLAGAVWVANYHVFKLAYTARPDMMLALFMTLAILAMQYQRRYWHLPASSPRPLTYWLWLVVLWLSVAIAGLTKGPPALTIAALVAIMLWHDRRLWSSHTWPHVAGLTVAIAITVGWLLLAIHYYPQWNDVLDKELWNRLTGEATHTKHYPPRWREITYFLGRFIPWSLLAIAAMAILPWWRRPQANVLSNVQTHSAEASSTHTDTPNTRGTTDDVKGDVTGDATGNVTGQRVGNDSTPTTNRVSDQQLTAAPASAGAITWAAVWVLVVLGILALPKGRRADHILPVYAGACVLVAALVVWAQEGHKASRAMTHLLTGGVLIFGILLAIASYWLPRPTPMHWPIAAVTPVEQTIHTTFILIIAAFTLFIVGIAGLSCLHRRRYYHAGFLACLSIVAMLGVYSVTLSRAAQNRNGDYVTAVARTAQQLAADEKRTPLFYDTGYVPVQSLMGYHREMMTYQPVAEPALVITTTRGWSTLQAAGAQGQVLLQTPTLEESSGELVLVRPTLLPDSLPEAQPESITKSSYTLSQSPGFAKPGL